MIPRGIRKEGSVYVADSKVFLSTNLFACQFSNADEALAAGTWMTTVFYQIMCEISSKNEEGMRKMEKMDIEKTYIPKLSNVSSNTMTKLKALKGRVDFLDLHNPNIRNVDTIWAEELFGTKASAMLDDAIRILTYLADIREAE